MAAITFDTNFRENLNRSFTILNSIVKADSADNVTTLLIGADLVSAINGNFSKSNTEAPSAIKNVFIGMTGSQLLSYINDNFTAKAASVSETLSAVGSLLNINPDVLAIYDAFDTSTITKDGSNVVTKWKDKLGSGRDLDGSCTWSATNGMTFNGVNEYLKGVFVAAQPFMVYILLRQKTWTEGKIIFDGNIAGYCQLSQHGGTENNYICASAGVSSNISAGLSLNSWGVVRSLFNGANSFLKIDDIVEINGDACGPDFGDFGSRDPNGFTLGANVALTQFTNIDVQAIILTKAVQSTTDEENINKWFKSEYMSKYRFNSGKVIIGWDGDVMPDIYAGHQILHQNGLKDTLFLCGRGGGGTYNQTMWDTVAAMAANGTDIQAHGYDHAMFNTLTEQQLIDNLAAMDAVITTQQGYPLPMHTAYPYGYNNALAREVVSRYKLTARGVRETQLTGNVINKFDLPGIALGATTNNPAILQKIKDQIDYAIANKTILILYCHGVGGTGLNAATMTAIAQYIVASGIENITHAELAALLV